MKKQVVLFKDLEKISETKQNFLVGGFSQSFSHEKDKVIIGGPSNNCWGGNCSDGCGVSGNKGCNTVAGCN